LACSWQYGLPGEAGCSQNWKLLDPGSPIGQQQQSILKMAPLFPVWSGSVCVGVQSRIAVVVFRLGNGGNSADTITRRQALIRCFRSPSLYLIGEGRLGRSRRRALPITEFFETFSWRAISAEERPSFQDRSSYVIVMSVQGLWRISQLLLRCAFAFRAAPLGVHGVKLHPTPLAPTCFQLLRKVF
jgi:hypothetical protein